MIDGNTAALNKYLEEQERLEEAYEELLEDLRLADPSEYEEIIDEHGWGDADLMDIIKDI